MPIIPFEGRVPRIHPTAFVAPTALVLGEVEIGEGASIWYGAVLRGDLDPIRVGARTSIQDNAVLHTGRGEPCLIGDDVTVGHSAVVHGCRIGNGCLVGMLSCVLNNAVVGDESIIGAGALVPGGKTYGNRSLLVGNPAKVLRTVSDEDLSKVLFYKDEYVKNGARHRAAIEEWYRANGLRL
jgi:carbonic anhydrase/acetyltransferase-like protein (isoleucine patch superfamily)